MQGTGVSAQAAESVGSCMFRGPRSALRVRRAPLALGLALLAGLLLRWQYLRLQEVIGTDGAWYAVLGYNVVRGHGYVDPTGAVSTFYPPLYPLSVGLLSLVVADLELAGRLAALLASLALIPVVYLTASLAFERRVAAVAALLTALLPALAENGVLVLSEALYTLCLGLATLAGILALRAAGRARVAWCALTGGALALAALTRPEGLPYALAWGVLLLVALRPARRAGWRKGWPALAASLAAFAVAYAALLAPYVVFLHHHTGQWRLSGKVATNVVVAYRGAAAAERNYFSLNEQGTGIGGFAADRDRLLDVIRQSPVGFVKHYRQGLVAEFDLLFDTLSPLLFALLPLGLVAVPWPPGRRWPRVAILVQLLHLALLPIFFLDQRFLLPMMPALLIVAAAGAVALAERLAGRDPHRARLRLGWLAGIVALWLVWFAPVLFIEAFGNYDPWNQAIESRRAGEWLRDNYPPGQVVMSRKPYVSFYSGNRLVELPLADYDATIAYARRQGARFLVIDERSLALYRPQLLFLLDGPPPPDLSLVYDWQDRPGYRIRLFELRDEGRGARGEGRGAWAVGCVLLPVGANGNAVMLGEAKHLRSATSRRARTRDPSLRSG